MEFPAFYPPVNDFKGNKIFKEPIIKDRIAKRIENSGKDGFRFPVNSLQRSAITSGAILAQYFTGIPEDAETSEVFVPAAIGNMFGRIIAFVAMSDFKEVIGAVG